MIEECPCRYCVDERHIGCHGKCLRYLKWKVKHDEENAQKYRERRIRYSRRTGWWYKTADGHWRNNKLPRRRK